MPRKAGKVDLRAVHMFTADVNKEVNRLIDAGHPFDEDTVAWAGELVAKRMGGKTAREYYGLKNER